MNIPEKPVIKYSSEEYTESYNIAVDSVAREEKFLATIEGFPIESTIGFIQFVLKNNYAQYFLVVEKEVKGWCDIIPKPIPEFSHVGVLGMGLLPDYRGKGFGRMILEKTIEHAKNINKLEKIELNVYESNEEAIKLYKKMGFFEEGKRTKSRKLNGKYDNEIFFGLLL